MRVSLFLLALLMFSCGRSPVKTGADADNTGVSEKSALGERSNISITCWGIGEIEFGDDLDALKEKAGEANVVHDSLFLEGNFERMITKVWPGTPQEITVVWQEEKPPFNKIKSLRISEPQSPYQFDNGIRIGTTLGEIVQLNNRDIRLYGFGWDYGGSFISFDKGKLQGDMPCFGGVFKLTSDTDPAASAIMGDRELSSAEPAFKNLEVVLSEITVTDKD